MNGGTSPQGMDPPMPVDRPDGERRELRLALVLYGGVSLCIYMHGTTKEIHHLVKASAMLAAGADWTPGPVEAVYRDLLTGIADEQGVRVDVVVDVIAGTSAGGINGVYLAKALAHNLSQDQLRDLWLDHGEIRGLLHGWRRLPVWLRAPFLLARLPREAPLRGDQMSVWLHEALDSMDEQGQAVAGQPSLIAQGGSLQLLVTTTDFYGYDRQVAIHDPKLAHDEQHRHVLQFTHDEQQRCFTRSHNVALAFAARVTSSFPGAFDPVSRRLFYEYLKPGAGVIEDSLFRIYELSKASVDDTYFIDGGVLDNRPFAPVIDALRARPADVEVQRRLLYLDPDPAPPTGRAPGERPGLIATLLGSVSGLPRKQPLLDSLLEIERLNARVREVQDIVKASFDEVTQLVSDATAGAAPVASSASPVAYTRCRVTAVIHAIADAIGAVCDYPRESNQGMLVAATLHLWSHERGLFADASPLSDEQLRLVGALDAGWVQRRARFVLAGVNWWYEQREPGLPARAELDAVKRRLWRAILALDEAWAGAAGDLKPSLALCFPQEELSDFLARQGADAAAWLSRRRAAIDDLIAALSARLGPVLTDIDRALERDLRELMSGWNEERRQALLVRYVGFPTWDARLYPLESAIGAGERDAIEVVRMSPLDATLLTASDGAPIVEAKQKLDGVSKGHFGAFFERSSRENDYLIGRLDGAERLITLVFGESEPACRQWCARAFLAILEEEQPVLKTAAARIAQLREQAQALLA